MRIVITKLIGKEIMDKACSFTINKETKSNLDRMYRAEHSPIRTQIFWIEMYEIYTFVSVHFVRHTQGVSHFVKSNRNDRSSYSGDAGRFQPLNHAMLINAQGLINMARKRLCNKSHEETRKLMQTIVTTMKEVDPDLAKYMVKECEYRKGCNEMIPCGNPYKSFDKLLVEKLREALIIQYSKHGASLKEAEQSVDNFIAQESTK